jgi:hypothetical protein
MTQDSQIGFLRPFLMTHGDRFETYPDFSDSLRTFILGNRASGDADSRKPGFRHTGFSEIRGLWGNKMGRRLNPRPSDYRYERSARAKECLCLELGASIHPRYLR